MESEGKEADWQQHPNEYIRGATLRFLQKIRESELLEPLVPTVRSCLVSSPSVPWPNDSS